VFRRELFERLGRAARVTQVSASPGSGKTFLLRSWIGAAGLAEDTAWVPVRREERDPRHGLLSGPPGGWPGIPAGLSWGTFSAMTA
jgi:ATP/maltotriose-dependent transcriptional regulator MalT